MKKNSSLKIWLSVFFSGIWQFVRNLNPVQPINKDLYKCAYRLPDVGMIINSKGEIANQ